MVLICDGILKLSSTTLRTLRQHDRSSLARYVVDDGAENALQSSYATRRSAHPSQPISSDDTIRSFTNVEDSWFVVGHLLARIISVPRTTSLSPLTVADTCAVPFQYIDFDMNSTLDSDVRSERLVLTWIGTERDIVGLSNL